MIPFSVGVCAHTSKGWSGFWIKICQTSIVCSFQLHVLFLLNFTWYSLFLVFLACLVNVYCINRREKHRTNIHTWENGSLKGCIGVTIQLVFLCQKVCEANFLGFSQMAVKISTHAPHQGQIFSIFLSFCS